MSLRRGMWSPEEDEKLKSYITRYGIWNWKEMAAPAGLLRTGKSCRLRWMNYLRPGIKLGNFTVKEDETIIRMQKMVGNRWCKIAEALPGRTDNEIKNHWHTNLKKKLLQKPGSSSISATTTSGDAPSNTISSSSSHSGSGTINSTLCNKTCKSDLVIKESCIELPSCRVDVYSKIFEEAANDHESKSVVPCSDMWTDPTCLMSSCGMFSNESIIDNLLTDHSLSADHMDGLFLGDNFHF